MQRHKAPRFVWYELHTPDEAASSAFYNRVLGWTSENVTALGRPYLTLRAKSTAFGGLLPKSIASFEADGSRPGWIGYVEVEDANGCAVEVLQAGGRVHRAVEEIAGLGLFAVVADPQGALFTLYQPFNHESPSPSAASESAVVIWHALVGAEWREQFNFYSSLFGWTEVGESPSEMSCTHRTFSIDGMPLGGMSSTVTVRQSPGWTFYAEVDDLEVAVARVSDAGGTVIDGPYDVAPNIRISRCSDPLGFSFGMASRVYRQY